MIAAGRPRRLVARFPERRTFAAALTCSVLLHAFALSFLRLPPTGPASRADSPLNLLLIAVPRWSPPQALELPAPAPAPPPHPLGTLPPSTPGRPIPRPTAPETPQQRRGHTVTMAPSTARAVLPSRLADARAYLDPSQLSRYPQLASPLDARYPRRAMEEGRREAVGLQLLIDERGAVVEAQVAWGDPSEEFAEAALAAARAARFLPAEAGGRPVKARAYFSVYFVIE